jgi:hypothetical protein
LHRARAFVWKSAWLIEPPPPLPLALVVVVDAPDPLPDDVVLLALDVVVVPSRCASVVAESPLGAAVVAEPTSTDPWASDETGVAVEPHAATTTARTQPAPAARNERIEDERIEDERMDDERIERTRFGVEDGGANHVRRVRTPARTDRPATRAGPSD